VIVSTALPASKKASERIATLRPRRPRETANGCTARSTAQTVAQVARTHPITAAACANPEPWRIATITELIEPGPAKSGSPSGTTPARRTVLDAELVHHVARVEM
jgi:hypothetical protein